MNITDVIVIGEDFVGLYTGIRACEKAIMLRYLINQTEPSLQNKTSLFLVIITIL